MRKPVYVICEQQRCRSACASATLNFHGLINGKYENLCLLLFHCRYFDESLMSGPLPNIYYLYKPLDLIGCHGNQKAEFVKNIKKSTQKLSGSCRNVHSISFYKSIVFIAVAYALWLLWQLKSFHRLIMGKMKIGFNCCLIAGILTERFKNRLLSSSPPSIKILCKYNCH